VSIEFQRAVIRELDQIRQRIEQAVEKLEERDEERDSEVSDLKLQVGLLRQECRRNIKRDAGLVVAPTTVVAIATALLNWLQSPPPVTAPAVPVPSAITRGP
jgi:hypothetical protein